MKPSGIDCPRVSKTRVRVKFRPALEITEERAIDHKIEVQECGMGKMGVVFLRIMPEISIGTIGVGVVVETRMPVVTIAVREASWGM